MNGADRKHTGRGLLERSLAGKFADCIPPAVLGLALGVFFPHVAPYVIRKSLFSPPANGDAKNVPLPLRNVDIAFYAGMGTGIVGDIYIYTTLASNHGEFLLLPAATNVLSAGYELCRCLSGRVRD